MSVHHSRESASVPAGTYDHGHFYDRDPAVISLGPRTDPAAARNRAWFAEHSILAVNLVSAPGAGKTRLLERTVRDLGQELAIAVIEADQAGRSDCDRLRAAGGAAIQLNTGAQCHLEADMVARGLAELQPAPGSVVLIENVGNLVCPARLDLGERAKVVMLSVTDGDDKPAKYPEIFAAATMMIVNKIDLLPHVDFSVDRAVDYARAVNPDIQVLWLSARSGKGLDGWHAWLRREAGVARGLVA